MPVLTGPDPTDVVGRRVVAWLLDGVIDYVVALGIIYALGIPQLLQPESQVRPGQTDPNVAGGFLLSLLGVSLLIFLGNTILVGLFGWTPGKLMLGLRVVRYDGRPPGMGRAAIRGVVDGLGQNLLGCIYMLPALFFAMNSKGHRQPADLAANTYVIDAHYQGRLLLNQGDKIVAGPHAVHRDELEEAMRAEGMAVPVNLPANGLITEPFYDKTLDTHVVFSKKREQWLRFDKKTGSWQPIDGQPTPT